MVGFFHFKTTTMLKYLLAGFLALMSIPLSAQTLLYDSGISLRNNKLNHYYKMVSWDDNQYKEFNYRNLKSTGGVVEFMNWRAIFPEGYNSKDKTKKYPMIVMLHGAGESGRSWKDHFVYLPTDLRYDNNGHNLLHGGEAHRDAVNRPVTNSRAFPGIVIFPQVSYSGSWEIGWNLGLLSSNGKMAIKVIEYMINNYNADINRIYMHGLSNGARGTWDISAKRPDLIAAVLPMSGVTSNLTEVTNIHVTTPVWLFQGGLDVNPTPSGALSLINAFISKGGNPRYTLYPNTAHSTWYEAYAEPDFFSWMLAQDKRKIYVFGGLPQVCQGESLKMGFSAGFLAYQWTLNGSNIPGATTRFLTTDKGGTYTVKFKRNDDQWYESFPTNVILREASTVAPVLANTGSVILPIEFSASNIVDLVAPTGYSEYNWFKNGTKFLTTTTNIKNIATGTGSSTAAGSYTVKVKESSGCLSLSSNNINVVYTTPHVNPTPPVQSTPVVVSDNQVSLKWTDSPGEDYYEIWRYRKAINGYTTESYKLVGKQTQNTLSYVDAGLRPMAQYAYKIRAIAGNDGRFSNEKSIVTPNDIIAPTVPTNPIVSKIAGFQASFSWTASTDNDQIASYEVFLGTTLVGSSTTTSYLLTGLIPGETYTAGVRAVDGRGNRSAIATTSFYIPTEGVAYKYYESAVALSSLASFDFTVAPTKAGVVSNFDISIRSKDDQFVFSYEGYLQVDAVGTYTFFTSSDDGSRLYINNTLVVENDGLHGTVEQSGSYTFNAIGRYPIKVTFFENGGGEVLLVSYDPPGSAAKRLIPSNKLFLIGGNSNYVPTDGVAYKYYETGDLSSLESFNFAASPTEVGTVNNFDIGVRSRDDQFVFSFEGYLQVDVTGTYTFYTASDDGSRLYIDNTMVVDNDGLHGTVEQSGSYTFNTAGRYPIKVTFFENGGGEVLEVSYDPPGTAIKQAIPDNKLFLSGDANLTALSTPEYLVVEPTAKELSVYPNPFTNSIMIDLDSKGTQRIDIVDPMKSTIKSYFTNGTDQVNIDVSDLAPGVYYLSIGNTKIRILKKE
jgi:predicted esterase